MQKYSLKLLFFIGVLVLIVVVACKEEPPYINYQPEYVTYETTYVDLNNIPSPQPREVLLEDISGVKCVNCPDAAKIVKDLRASYPGRVNAITIYPNISGLDQLTKPVNKPAEGFVSKYDLRSPPSGPILTAFGIPNSLPSGYVNRKVFSGTINRYLNKEDWATRVVEEKDSVTPVNIWMKTSYAANGDLITDVRLNFTKDLAGDYFVTVAIIQDSIIDVQEYNDSLVGASYNPNYVHMHVLRQTFTGYTGDKINNVNTTLVRGRVVEKRYQLALVNAANNPSFPPYNKKQLSVIAFVHRGYDGVVVQSKELKVAE